MSTANNNAVAYATRTTLPTGDFRLIFWHQASTGVVSSADFSQVFEAEYGGGNYVQLYSNGGDATPELRLWRNEVGSDSQVLASTSYVSTWVRYQLARTGTTWTLYYAILGDTSWTQITTWTNAAAWSRLAIVGSSVSPGSYTMPGALIRSVRLYAAAHSLADTLADTLSATATLTNLWSATFDGASASLDGSDSSGNSRPITVAGGLFITAAADPISSGLAEAAHTERVRNLFSGFSTALGPAAVTTGLRYGSAGVASSMGGSGQTSPVKNTGSFATTLGIGERTEPIRRSFQGVTSALAGTPATERQAVLSAGVVTAFAAAQTTERSLLRFGDFSSTAAAMAFAHTEWLRVTSGGAATAFAGSGGTTTAAVAGSFGAALAAGATSETIRAASAGLTSAAAANQQIERLRASAVGLASSMAAAAFSGQDRLRFPDFSTSGAALIFAHTEALRVASAGLTSSMAESQASERVAVRSSDFAASLGANSATEATEQARSMFRDTTAALGLQAATERSRVNSAGVSSAFVGATVTEHLRVLARDFAASIGATTATEWTEHSKVLAQGFATAFGATIATETGRVTSAGVVTAMADALATEFAKLRPGSFTTSAASIIFAHTEALRNNPSVFATAFAGSGNTEPQRVGSAGVVSAMADTVATDWLKLVAQAAGATLGGSGASIRGAVTSSGGITAAAADVNTTPARLRASDFSSSAVIFGQQHTEILRTRASDVGTSKGSTVAAEALRIASAGITSAMGGASAATTPVRVRPVAFSTDLGAVMALERTEQVRVAFRDSAGVVSVVEAEVVVLGAYGSGPFGSMHFGTAMPEPSETKRIRAITANAILVPFAGSISTPNPRNKNSPLNPRNWALSVIEPYSDIVRLPQQVLHVFAGQRIEGLPTATDTGFVLVFDGVLPQGTEHRVSALAPGLEITADQGYEREFESVSIRCDALERDARDDDGGIRDIANPFVSRDALQFPPALGTYQFTDGGDLANDSGEASLRKRIYRRVTAAVGDFFHAAGYGAGVLGRVKRLVRVDELVRIQTRVQAQVSKEPDVLRCAVTVRPSNGDNSVVIVTVSVTTASNPKPTTLVVPV